MMTASKFAIACILPALLVPQQASAQDAISDCLPEDAGDRADEVNLLQNRASSATILAGSRKLVDTEFVADMVFHPPTVYQWASARMSLKLEGSKFTGFRLAQKWSVPTVYEGFTSMFDKVGVCESNGTLVCREQVGTHCGNSCNEILLFSDLVEVEDGSLTFNGTSCEQGMRATNWAGNMTLCLDAAGAPIHFYTSYNPGLVGKTNLPIYLLNATFENVSLGELPADAFSFPEVCLEGPGPVACPVEEGNEFETMIVTRYQNPGGEECGLGNKQASDDLAALTTNLRFPGLFKYVQVFNVTVDRRWGTGLDCNYHPFLKQSTCNVQEARNEENLGRVGRSSQNYLTGPHGGQCAENDVVGSWYSFPSQGECAAGWAMGYRNCTWKTHSFRLVEYSCILFSCGALVLTEHSPYTEAIKCIVKARMECPDVSTSSGMIQTGTCLARPGFEQA